MKVLFVCTGNTCRSCMAEGFFKLMLDKDNNKEVEVFSAGLYAFEGSPATEEAIKVGEEFGVDLKSHKARRLTKQLVDDAELILCMTVNHKHQIINFFPNAQDKTFTLKEYAYLNEAETVKNNLDIGDPFGMSIDMYKECAREIWKSLERVYAKIRERKNS